MEDGMQKKVTENYVVDALSFSEAEERITEEMSSYVSGEFDVADIKIAPYADFFADNDPDNSQVRQLHARISRLGLVDRAIVLLWLENLSYDEIGAIVGISAKNVSVKLVRIRQQLIRMNNGD